MLQRRSSARSTSAYSVVELIVAFTILSILVSAALPLLRVSIQRQRETDLRRALREMRDAIDRYKIASDQNLIEKKLDTEGYPPDLQTMVDGVPMLNTVDKKLKFLRRIPKDPMTGTTDWGLRSYQDDPESTSWGGQNVFDVYTKSTATALDGTKYSDW
ncbi:MAG: type II secretion system protein [Acidobacteriia bacterium]|nr:type II secretion system protein [Terriglobia bacterium]